MPSGKRKRDDLNDLDDLPRITYIVGDRTFERLFKEKSLDETKDLVRRKLQLPSYSKIKLKQLRDGKSIDLDDDDDFDAFYARARSVMSMDVAVDITDAEAMLASSKEILDKLNAWNHMERTRSPTNDQPPEDADVTVATEPKPKKRKKGSEESAPVASSSKLSAKSKVSTVTKATTDPTDERLAKKPKAAKADTSKDVSSTQVVTKLTEKPSTDSIDGQPPKKKSRTAKADTSKDVTSTPVVTKSSRKPPAAIEVPKPKKSKTVKADVSEDAPSAEVIVKPTEKPLVDPADEQLPKKLKTSKADTSKDATSTSVAPLSKPKKKSNVAKAGTSEDATSAEIVAKPTEESSVDPIDGQPPKKPKAAKAGTSKDATSTPVAPLPKPKKLKTTKADTSEDVIKPTEKPPKKTKKAVESKEPPKLPSSPNAAVSAPPSPAEPSGKSSGIEKKKVARKPPILQSIEDERSANPTENGVTTSEKTKVKSKPKDRESEVQARKPAVKISSTKDREEDVIAEVAVAKEKKSKESKPTKAKDSNADADRPLDVINIQDNVNRIASAKSTISLEEEGKATMKDINAEKNSVDTSRPSASSPLSVIKTTKGGVSSSPLCHVCSGSFHPLYWCPTVLAGHEAIRNKLEELKKAGTPEHQLAIKDLESLLNSSGVAVSSASNAAQEELGIDNKSDGEATKAAEKSGSHSQPSWTPLMPNHSLLSEVTVESRGEGSSSEEEDEFGQEPEQEGHDIETSQPSLDNVDLDAIMRGPTPIKLRNLISIMESKEVGFDTEDEDDDMGPLEVEDDGAEERKYRRLSQHLAESSDEKEDVEDGGGDDDSKKRSMLPPKISARPNGSTSNAKDPVGSRTDVIPTSDSDDMRVSFSGAPDSTKALPEGNGKAAEALDLDKPSDTSPIGGTSLLCNKTEANNDPIEPADDLVESMHGRAFDIDPIEATTPPGLKATIPLSPVIHSTPKSGVVKRMKNRHGQHPSPSQIPVRADDPEMTRRAKVATGTGSDQLSIRGGTGRTRADLPHVSSQPVGRGATFAKMNGNAATPFHSQPLPKIPTSLAKWDVIRESSPSVMTDEIDRSSPLLDGPVEILGELAGQASDQNDVGERSDDGSADKSRKPLFELTESLVPFPDSQGNSPLQNHLDVPASQVPFPYSKYNAPIQKRFEVVEDSEFETDGGEKEKKTVAKGRRSIAPYRKLSDIAASQSALFSQSTPVVPRPSTLTSRKVWQADDADDETSSSDSDGGSQSHIPEAMRAGRLRSKKLKGLLGLNY